MTVARANEQRESRDAHRQRLADQQRRACRQLRHLAVGTRFAFGATTGARGRPHLGIVGVVIAQGSAGGVTVALDRRRGWERATTEEWSGLIYVLPLSGATGFTFGKGTR